jgi:caffeoyl-CoA O-methyltransferase
MPDKFTQMSPELHRYAVEHSDGQDELMARLAEETEREAGDMAIMQTAPEQAALMTVVVRALGARRALELGTFTGYGSIAIARGLPDDGRLVTCDVSEQWTTIARRYFEQAGLEDRIELRLGPALETLSELPEDEAFDFAFIDADKENYPAYYEECLRLLRPGGMLMLDNVFRGGSVLEGASQDENLRSRFGDEDERLRATREVNERVVSDERVISAMVGIADGVTVAVKL